MKKNINKILLISSMLCIGITTYPAAAPGPLPENLTTLRQMFAPGGTGTIHDFEQLSCDVQNEIIEELLIANNNDVQKTFFHAVRNNLLWAIQPLIDRGAWVNWNCYDAREETALAIAAKQGYTELVNILMANKINWGQELLHFLFERPSYPLHAAASNGHIEIVKALLANKFYVNEQGPCGTTALGNAAAGGHTATIKALLNAKANLDVLDGKLLDGGKTALMRAAGNGHAAAVQTLIDAKANLDALDGNFLNSKKSALIFAAENGHAATVKTLIGAKANLDIQNCEYITALAFAARRGRTDVVKALIDAKAQLDILDVNEFTALMHAASNGHAAAVDALLNANAQIDTDCNGLLKDLISPNRSKSKALAIALRHGHVNIAQLIADRYRHEIVRSDCRRVQYLENGMRQIHRNFKATGQHKGTKASVSSDNRSDFEQLPNTFLQTMSEYLTLTDLAKLRLLSKTCRIITQVQLETQLRTQLKGKFLRQQEQQHRAFIRQETRGANLRNPLTIQPFDYWQAALDAAREKNIAGPAEQTDCAIA